jgi:hypothetical protein
MYISDLFTNVFEGCWGLIESGYYVRYSTVAG